MQRLHLSFCSRLSSVQAVSGICSLEEAGKGPGRQSAVLCLPQLRASAHMRAGAPGCSQLDPCLTA
jgi:hypothetical protein